jgi:hypothetical protein
VANFILDDFLELPLQPITRSASDQSRFLVLFAESSFTVCD